MITWVSIQAVVIVSLMVLYFRNALHSDADVQNARLEIQERDNEIYNLKDDLAKVRHEHEELIVVFKARNEGHASEIQNLHSVYQRKLDDADEKLRLELQEFANVKAELFGERNEALRQLDKTNMAHYEKAKELAKLQDDVALLNRRLKDYDERIRTSESARLVAESQLSSIREVCCGK